MRGKIIQYNGADGTGTLVIDGHQHRFVLPVWQGDAVPETGRVVEVELDGETVTKVAAVPDDVLLKEKMSRFGTLVGQQLGALGAKASAMAATATAADASSSGTAGGDGGQGHAATGGAGATAGAMSWSNIVARYGWVLIAAYALFVLGTLVFDAIRIQFGLSQMGRSLFDVAGLMSQMQIGGGGSTKLLLLIAYASFFVPLFRPGRRAWLALVVPLVALVWAVVSTLYTVGHALGPVADSEFGSAISQAFSVGAGLYLAAIAAIVLAAAGVQRALRSA